MSNKDMNERRDRIAPYLYEKNKGILFDELQEEMLEKMEAEDFLRGVPVPILGAFGDEINTVTIAIGMGRVLGGDGNFPYREAYLSFMHLVFGDQAVKVFLKEGASAATHGDDLVAAMFFRMALILEPKSCDALYLYALACRNAYTNAEGEEDAFVGNFKAESMEAFETLTLLHPDFAEGYYYLGFCYANMGLYLKAKLTWESFMQLTAADTDPAVEEEKQEIQELLEKLTEPVKIEEGINHVLSGDYQGGEAILRPYTDSSFASWWPLWYYLGMAESAMGNLEQAVSDYKNGLTYSPSNEQILEDLILIFDAVGDREQADKYRKKLEIVGKNAEADREEAERVRKNNF